MKVHEMIRKYIEQQGIKQGVVASKIGMSPQTMSAMLAGKRKMYVEDLRAICDALGVEAERFMYNIATPPPSG
jgi:transcriptional regulator with XRE-family HTH domain